MPHSNHESGVRADRTVRPSPDHRAAQLDASREQSKLNRASDTDGTTGISGEPVCNPADSANLEVAPSISRPSVMQGRLKLGSEALIYMLGMILGRAASLIMLPVYTRVLTPADYGVLQLLDMTSDVVAIIVSAGCTAGVMRFYFKAQHERERRAVLGSAITLQIGLNLIGTLLIVIFARPIWQNVLHGAQREQLVYLAAANFTLGSLSIVPLIYMQIEKRALLFSAISVARLVMQLAGNILFLVVLHEGPGGVLLSSLIVNIIFGILTASWMIRRVGIVVSKEALLDLRRFGLPYQLVTIGTFVVTFGDRIFLDKYGGLASVGLYSLAYQFGFILNQVGISPFVRAWTPRRFEFAHEPTSLRDAKNAQGFRYLNVLAFTCAVGIAVFVHPVLRILAHQEYWSAADIVPVILAAYIVQGWGTVVELGIDLSEKTRYANYGVWASVAAVLVLYPLLIPTFGGHGAAWATLLSFLVRFAFHWRFSQRLWPIDYGWGPVLRLAAYATVVSLASSYLRPESVVAELGLGIGLFGLFVVAIWTTTLGEEERESIRALAANRLRLLTTHLSVA
jgi:O-antigen/teichoic acid export membrane protein